MPLTAKTLQKFVAIRNKSGFNSNLQFQCDATDAGFSVDELGTPEKVGEGHYRWPTAFGVLVEQAGVLRIE